MLRLLPLWLLVVALLRLLSIYLALKSPETLAQSLFAAAPSELTPLGARVFAAWTGTTCVLCLLCAYEGANPTTPIYLATALSFVVALALFIPELAVHSTMTWQSIASPALVASASLAWMAAARWKPMLTASHLLKAGAACTVLVEGHMLFRQAADDWPDRLDTYLFWDESIARALLDDLGADGRAAYVRFYTHPLGDLALPFCYGVGLSGLCHLRLSRRTRAADLLTADPLVEAMASGLSILAVALPLLAALCDLAENLSVLTLLLESYPPASESSYRSSYRRARPTADFSPESVQLGLAVGPKATLAKWALLALTAALLAGSALGRRGSAAVEELEGPVSPLRERMRQARKSMKDVKRE